MRTYASSVASGEAEGPSAYMMAYGIYLMNGGTPEDFLEFTPDDIQIMLTTYLALQTRQINMISGRILGKEE